jgi:DNA-binding transcriptional ArsR family regulator
MSLGDAPERGQAALRALAHPVRLQIMSLLTGASLTAAEVARELGLTHANASYHLRSLLAAKMILLAGEEKIRGGVAKRYRYDAGHDIAQQQSEDHRTDAESRSMYVGLANELIRRAGDGQFSGRGGGLLVDAELWIEPETWSTIRDRIGQAARDLHDAAKPPRTPGTIRTSTTLALFAMQQPERPTQQPENPGETA